MICVFIYCILLKILKVQPSKYNDNETKKTEKSGIILRIRSKSSNRSKTKYMKNIKCKQKVIYR